ncbi:DNA-binding domain-containing protein [Caballeronia sp. dw_19]|uniref:HvfC/BufC N-terminal domain-containing protein n=1 Tax=Caballeronia sp. dw_19 TaxID=2719791 RepID=UPI001BD4DA18|nr:DNA-binding domain-containing protein [Caballeronia sp. dw_19]
MTREKTLQVSARPLGGSAGLNADCLCEQQRNFAAALLDPNMPVPRGLIGPDREPSEKRFNVYRNNVVAGLVEALKAAYPAVCRIVGHDFFAAMARVYVALEPPRSPVVLDYGETFPDFIERFEPAKSVPYLRDVARLERAWVEAYHAAEAPPVDPAPLATIDSQSLPQIGFMLHPTVRVVRSSFPVVQIWLMNIDAGDPAAIDISSGGENALVVRPIAEVEVRRLPAGAATFVIGLAAGASVADATALALDEDGDFDLAGALQDLFAINAIVGWTVREGSEFSSISRVA